MKKLSFNNCESFLDILMVCKFSISSKEGLNKVKKLNPEVIPYALLGFSEFAAEIDLIIKNMDEDPLTQAKLKKAYSEAYKAYALFYGDFLDSIFEDGNIIQITKSFNKFTEALLEVVKVTLTINDKYLP